MQGIEVIRGLAPEGWAQVRRTEDDVEVTTMRALDIQPGSSVIEKDGYLLEVSKVETDGKFVVLHFVHFGLVKIAPKRLRASAVVKVSIPVPSLPSDSAAAVIVAVLAGAEGTAMAYWPDLGVMAPLDAKGEISPGSEKGVLRLMAGLRPSRIAIVPTCVAERAK